MMAAAHAEPLAFADAGRLPAPGDNVAIAIRTLPAGALVLIRQLVFELPHTVLEGHRFAIFRIRKGEPLLSWGLPFGLATRDIEPGEYICNEKILRVLTERQVQFQLPPSANFLDYRLPFELDAERFRPGKQVSAPPPHPTFNGFSRGERRGAGTRNYILVLGTNSRSAPLARTVAEHFQGIQEKFRNIDGVVPVDHTEGGSVSKPNNLDLTLRTLAGFIVNPNVGAVLCLDLGGGFLSNEALRAYLESHRYPIEDLLHDFVSVDAFESCLKRSSAIIQSWLPKVNAFKRANLPLSHLRLGLQCGGSDAFSGVSGNPLVGILSRETVAHGGSANLAETTELIGAESYVLANVRDFATAQAFVEKSQRYQDWAALHGHTAEGNPSGGNNYRGLYNIAIKSIGAARKKDPATRLDYVIDFGERMTEPGFYFMDSPGNDLESIAGQVAAGCNMILFSTGNGSITNFPFVPTIKIMTTTARFELVRNEMDLNAGRYQHGEPLEQLGREAFDYMLEIASGRRSAGEKAGHSQVQLWREWRTNAAPGAEQDEIHRPPLAEFTECPRELLAAAKQIVTCANRDRVALILPTSLCAGQIALLIAAQLNREKSANIDRAVALPHTEGCGNSGGESERLFLRTMAGYLAHPLVAKGLLLEHGCEKTHNDAFRNVLREMNLPEGRFGFRSIQLDGGIESVTRKTLEWFSKSDPAVPGPGLTGQFTLALHGREIPRIVAESFALLQCALLQAGAAIVLSRNVTAPRGVALHRLEYGEPATRPMLHRMDCPTEDDTEIITGLAAAGAEIIVTYLNTPIPANPLAATLRVASHGADADITIEESTNPRALAESLLKLMLTVRQGKYLPLAQKLKNCAFQITRGREGISL